MLTDAFEAARALSDLVERPGARRVLRIGAAAACGGAVTVYLPGCNLGCIHCWAGPDREDPEGAAPWWEFPRIAACIRTFRRENRIDAAADRIRLSGGEPILGERFFELLAVVLRLPGMVFVETNGTVLGAHTEWCEKLAALRDRVFLKVSIKAGTAGQFARLTGCDPIAWESTWRAVESLARAGAAFDLNALSLCRELFSSDERDAMRSRLAAIDSSLAGRLEEEGLTGYPATLRRMAAGQGAAGAQRSSPGKPAILMSGRA